MPPVASYMSLMSFKAVCCRQIFNFHLLSLLLINAAAVVFLGKAKPFFIRFFQFLQFKPFDLRIL